MEQLKLEKMNLTKQVVKKKSALDNILAKCEL